MNEQGEERAYIPMVLIPILHLITHSIENQAIGASSFVKGQDFAVPPVPEDCSIRFGFREGRRWVGVAEGPTDLESSSAPFIHPRGHGKRSTEILRYRSCEHLPKATDRRMAFVHRMPPHNLRRTDLSPASSVPSISESDT